MNDIELADCKTQDEEHARQMGYSKEIREIVESEMHELIKAMEKGDEPFSTRCIDHYYRMYLHMRGNKNEKYF